MKPTKEAVERWGYRRAGESEVAKNVEQRPAKKRRTLRSEISSVLDAFKRRLSGECENLGFVESSKKLSNGGRLTIRYTDPREKRRR